MSIKNSRLNKKIRRDEKVVKAYRAKPVREAIWVATKNKYGHTEYNMVLPPIKE